MPRHATALLFAFTLAACHHDGAPDDSHDLAGLGDVDGAILDGPPPSDGPDGALAGDGGIANDGALDPPDGGGPPGIAFEMVRGYRAMLSGPTALLDATGDGRIDVIGTNHWDGTIEVIPGDGKGGFGTSITTAVPFSEPSIFAAGDLDSDGDPDVVVGSSSQVTNNIELRFNDGAGHFGSTIQKTVTWPGGAWILDLDGNGRADLVINRNGTLDVFRQEPGGLSTTAVSTPLPLSPRGLSFADYTGDGKPDVAFLTTLGDKLRIGMCPGAGDGSFGTCVYTDGPKAPLNPWGGSLRLRGDNRADFYASVDDGSTALFAGTTGPFAAPNLLPAPGLGAVISAELTPGTPFLVGGADRFTFEVLADSGGGMTRRARYDVDGNPIGLADLDGDGHPDLVTNAAFSIDVALGRSDGTFIAAPTSKVTDFSSQVLITDLDHDGRLDVATFGSTSSFGAAYRLYVQLQKQPGVFTELAPHFWSGRPIALKIVDIDGDLIPDLVAWASDTSVWQSCKGKGDGTFAAPVALADEVWAATPADAGSFVRTKNYTVEVRKGAGAWTAIAGLANVVDVLVVDVDKDSKLDLLVSKIDTGDHWVLAYLHGNGDGTYAAAQLTAVPTGLWGWSIADIDGDGDVDVVVGGDPLTAVRAQGAGAFAAPSTLPGTTCSFGPTFSDFDGDGKIDFACPRHSSGGSVYAGDGAGGFTLVQSFAGAPADVVATADLDGDGKSDLIASGFGYTWRARNVSRR